MAKYDPKLIDSRRLWLFYNVAETGSFSRAEAVIGVPQPAISRHISKLEEDLDVRLLERHGRGVSLTPMGSILFDQASVILGEMASTIDAMEMAKRKPGGRVSISASSIVMSRFMPEITQRFISKFPDVEITAIQAVSGQIYDQLVSGKVDVAIVIAKPNKHRFESIKLLEEPMVMIARKDHPAAHLPAVKRSMLGDFKLVLPASPHGMRSLLDNYFEEGDFVPAPHVQADSVPLTVKIVEQGDFVTIMPLSTFEHEFNTTKCVGIPLSPVLTRSLYVAYQKPREGDHNPHVQALIDEVVAVFQDESKDLPRPTAKKVAEASAP